MSPAGRTVSPDQKRATVERLLAAWLRVPSLRLGQFIDSAARSVEVDTTVLEDDRLVKACEEMAHDYAGTPRWRVTPDGDCASRHMDAQGDLYRCEVLAMHIGRRHEGGGFYWFEEDGWALPFPPDEPVRNPPMPPEDAEPNEAGEA